MEMEMESRSPGAVGRNAELMGVGGRQLEVEVDCRMLDVGCRNADLVQAGGLEVGWEWKVGWRMLGVRAQSWWTLEWR